MDISGIIPHYQPLPFPAPLWLLQTLLVLGFFLHAIPMNVVLGGTPICATLLWLGRSDKSSFAHRTGRALAAALPLFISFAVTQGIVPLLFLQLLYGPVYYTSSILMAVPWLALIGILILAYYASYLVLYRYLKSPAEGNRASLVLFALSLVFLAIASLFSSNMTLMLYPQKWMELYHHSPYGLNLAIADRQLIPRFLHIVIGAVAVSGLAIGTFGLNWRNKEIALGNWAISLGSRIFLSATLVQLLVGPWFLLSLPAAIWGNFLGGNVLATATLVVALALAVVALVASVAGSGGSPGAFKLALGSGLAVVLAMSLIRHQLRQFLLDPYLSPSTVPVRTQWDLLIVFIICAVGLVWYLVWLTRMVWRAHQSGSA